MAGARAAHGRPPIQQQQQRTASAARQAPFFLRLRLKALTINLRRGDGGGGRWRRGARQWWRRGARRGGGPPPPPLPRPHGRSEQPRGGFQASIATLSPLWRCSGGDRRPRRQPCEELFGVSGTKMSSHKMPAQPHQSAASLGRETRRRRSDFIFNRREGGGGIRKRTNGGGAAGSGGTRRRWGASAATPPKPSPRATRRALKLA
jgi:hypothetical protein